jgi:hypothetical protein
VLLRCQRRADTNLLRELVLEHIGRVPTPAARLFARVREDFGTVDGEPVCERRLWRVLRWQLERGVIRVIEPRHGRGAVRCGSAGYVRVFGRPAQRLTIDEPCLGVCETCGAQCRSGHHRR